ncbi:adenine phosphoribosyltransferase [Saccharopolyspora erythraea NRRL 2338]|uniref:Adenine phosphoribosyltransferase n=2 Tax=Saccharopolyspora erythraea TaxID=1836 RepID=APT_SACEN|nr:adenine phosphoribosyltransferase [Saccharopolyspora erythraea]A4FBB2.1 RecName: Full=Adenine phosphoribosyltransferase; Short=APRT [Saccharopolyspora erythraea NRRL 2338]EQD86466.1 adenine phosphoribosyltransferase [Saccharopolyspora erythraea D]PFG95119.1 adenine phosphoribosyltransferase [Saccharopolyspora erythraea NRRL 2338]QRK91793.1 adenine phosphoribosyltransferase [Saccharopolyspora erythraea]CAM01337.1 adenine phosphoribosyltransferase [Saccharopolyspora erythraea NRRL 2338]
MSSPVRVLDELDAELRAASGLVREVPDFPEPGVLFRDISPMLADGRALAAVVAALGRGHDFDVVAGVEARGFLLGAAVAQAHGTGVVGLRKPGKLPEVAHRVDYRLEYGSASLELPAGTLRAGQRVLVVDDVLATGGTLNAACELVRSAGSEVAAATVVLELTALGGRNKVPDVALHALLTA